MKKYRLLRLADIIEIEHKHFYMGQFTARREEPEGCCGTTGCMAAFAVAEFHPHLWETYVDAFRKLNAEHDHVPDNGHIEESARELLGLTQVQADQLFFVEDWPKKYRDAYWDARSPRAKIAAKYLRACLLYTSRCV